MPACNEEARIEACLRALARQEGAPPLFVSLCVNNSTDRSAARAEAAAGRLGLPVLLTEVTFGTGGVGRARRLGHAAALRACPGAGVLLSTDADCVPAPGWAAGMAGALARAPVALGGICALPGELAALSPDYAAWSAVEDAYAALSVEFGCLLDPAGTDGIGINTAGGANLGLRREAYLALGGFRDRQSGEDRDIVARALAAGYRPVRARDAVVAASMRSDGRAPRGMAARVAARLARRDAPLDTALAPLEAMIRHHLAAQPGHRGAARTPMSRREALRDLPELERCVSVLRALPDVPARLRYLGTRAERARAGRSGECLLAP
ncbi:hypothetical protein RISW2_20765 [Roseivivax isoporae LMG 25204]|uniref:Glycosyltransferase 2-like domain-containing protein n=1 Tax=Roseivivax isoporae LMG 25204 TaxID=1449351 RepID=X7F1Q6_9RHOB|nr:hypothetical protein RISW2_20765 [Roseivivax isoporae LMG 25204]